MPIAYFIGTNSQLCLIDKRNMLILVSLNDLMYVAILGQIDDRCENKLFVKVKNGIGVSVQTQAH